MPAAKDVKLIGSALTRREIKRLVYFHTDHFEPWRHVPGRSAEMSWAAEDVSRYIRAVEDIEYARRPTLFLKSNINFAMEPGRLLHRAVPEDRIGFVPRPDSDRAIGRAIMAPIVSSRAELQLHIHHENFTWNGTLGDPATRAYLETPLGRSLDSARLELNIRLNLALIEEDGGPMLADWFFIHGHWALNASDPNECTIVREIELLMRNGCLGDFTQPSGRLHVDGAIAEPHLVRPVAASKGYDTAAADPVRAAGARDRAADRFFLWATMLDHRSASIDIAAKSVARRALTPGKFGLAQAEEGVLVGETLYVKTHSHSMAPSYWADGRADRFPHASAPIRQELETLFAAADAQGIEVAFLSASEVYSEIVMAEDRGAGAELARRPNVVAPATQVAFDLPDGSRGEPPALFFRTPRLAPPRCAEPCEDSVETAVATIVPWRGSEDAKTSVASPRASEQLNEIAVATIRARLAGDAHEQAGLTGFYVSRAETATLLQRAEVDLVAYALKRFLPAVSLWEIGCGVGLLTTLLAANGRAAVGIDRNGGRIETAKAIAAAMARAGHLPRHPVFLQARFPEAFKSRRRLAGSAALIGNLLGAADLAEQRRVIRGLRHFGWLVVDLQRFFTRRMDETSRAQLVAMFREEGFPPPEEAFNCGADGDYVLFGRAQLDARDAWHDRMIYIDRLREWIRVGGAASG